MRENPLKEIPVKKTLIVIAAVLVAPTTAAILVSGMVAVQELRFKLAMKKLENIENAQN